MKYFLCDLFNFNSKATYSVASTGIKTRSRLFSTKQEAKNYMFRILNRKGLTIKEKWDDGNFQTFLCGSGIRFYVNKL